MSGIDYVFVAVVGARFLLPLLIPRYPLPAVVGCLVLDGIDQSVFQWFGYDPPGYQSYDKAMDVYYLAIAYLATLRNWAALPAYAVGRFLYFYRLVGVVVFELTQLRAMLLLFPNTFEYFFIAYEAWRTRWQTVRITLRHWVVVAALIWVVVKLPQEYWLHVAQLDVTDTLAEYDWAWPLLISLILLLVAILWFVVRPRLPEPDWSLRLAADPLPEAIDTAAEQAAWRAASGTVVSGATFEKVMLLGLISVIYAQTLPGIHASNLQLFVGVGGFVVLNAAITLAVARRGRSIESAGLAFAARLLVSIGIVAVARLFLGSDASAWNTVFFLALISLITTLHDRWQPVLDYRRRAAAPPANAVPAREAGA
ncbi:hypothetical protein GCM10009844_14680 [Nocardioides koreensis]|uniref:Uncharacterized protein n=1 Tax=Nocardioides koreensis TaxID=433651 RepID=A0ABP5L7H3_9ACTN